MLTCIIVLKKIKRMTQFVIGFTYTVLSTAVYSCKIPKIYCGYVILVPSKL